MNKPAAARSINRLVFVYNADGGIAQGLLDAVHKVVSPSTYPCSLCAITYGALRMHPQWRAWLKALPMPVVFLHKDEVASLRGFDEPLPVVLAERDGRREVLLSAAQLDTLPDIDALIRALDVVVV